ncbi:MAG: hypothetical protein J5988_10370 [Eubacterium sp.]|nr:hypothetical protein [Eubacterium sp.]
MVKYIYKIVGLILIFMGALFFFGRQMETDVASSGESVEITGETFPYITLETQGESMNTLYGYSAPMDANILRESMTPLASDKTMKIRIGKTAARLTSIQYRIVDKESGEVYAVGEVNAIGKDQQSLNLVLDYGFKTSTEYILDLIGISEDGREIHYYTRIKYYLENSHLAEKMAFVRKFHKDTFNKSKIEELERYLEPDGKNRNNTLASVNITSSSDLVTWGGMSPEVVSEELVTIKEYNMETACVQYNYFVKATTASGEETYHIKEFYRVRYASGHNYLLNFDRTMEAEFDEKLASIQTSQLKLGITSDYDSTMLLSQDGKKVYFVRDGVLYEYDMDKNTIMKVYQTFSDDASYIYRAYNEQDIRLLKADEQGNLYFCAYGYFPRGAYEGDVAVVLYEYTADGVLQEMVYMPSSTTYQQLKEDFATYGYVSPRGIYYFTVANTVYAYNMTGKRLEKLAENIKSNTFMTMEGANCYVWSSSLSSGYGDSLILYNLETDERNMIYPPDKDTDIRLLGVIEDNVVYGFVKKSDISQNKDGTKVVPCYELNIADTKGTVRKTFSRKGQFVQSISSNGNVINMNLCKKSGSEYVSAGTDSILSQSESATKKVRYTSRVTNKSLTEWYIQLPSSYEMTRVPKQVKGPDMVTTSQRFVRLEQPSITKYYVYAVGQITGSYESARVAIQEADKQMGVVVSSNHQVVWERSGSFLQNNIGGMEMMQSGNEVSNLAACAYMVLKQNHFEVDAKALTKKKKPVYNMLADYMSQPVNLKGCTLEQVLYFVSNNKAVIAMTSDNKAVVISGYSTTQLYLFNPDNKKEVKVNRSEYEKIFKAAGNRFVSYME